MRKQKKLSPIQIVTSRYYMSKDITTYTKRSLIRFGFGVVCVVVGLATTPIPMTTIPLCVFGGMMMGYDMKGLIGRVVYEMRLKKITLLARMVRHE